MTKGNSNPNFWSISSLKNKIGLWKPDLIKNTLVTMIQLKSNETIYDIGSGFSPLGLELIPYILPNGYITGFDKDESIVDNANQYIEEVGLNNIVFKQADVFDLHKMQLEAADLVMCQQLLVNLNDYTTAIENMIDCTKKAGRILCIENINYGAYIHRPDFSWKSNLRLSQIWQELCISGKFHFDSGLTTIGAQLPQIFDKLDLRNIEYQIINPSNFTHPPYHEDFIGSFVKNYKQEKTRLRNLILNHWSEGTELSESDLKFFIEHVIDSEYDLYAVKNNLFLTQWYYPLMAIVGWLKEKKSKENPLRTEHINIQLR